MKISSNIGSGAQGAAAKNGAAGRNADDMDVKEFYNLEFGRMRTVTDKNGEPLFCGQDVCKALGYKRTDKAIRRHVNSSDVLKRSIARIVKNRYGQSTKTQKVQMLFVNESGVYSLVFGSKLESAQRFKLQVPIGDAERRGTRALPLHIIERNGDTRRSLPTSNDQVDALQEVAVVASRRAGLLRGSHPRRQYRQGDPRLHTRG